MAITWTEEQPAGASDQTWTSVSFSKDDSIWFAAVSSGRMYKKESGTWGEIQPAGDTNHSWRDIESSNGFNYALTADAVNNRRIWDGSSWDSQGNSNIVSVGVDSTGQYMLTGASDGHVYRSTNYGSTFSEVYPDGSYINARAEINMTAAGYAVCVMNNVGVYFSDDYGATWTKVVTTTNECWRGDSSNDGNYIIYGERPGRLHLSSNGGTSFSEIQPHGNVDLYWNNPRISSDGQYMIATSTYVSGYDGVVYFSTDYGATWSDETIGNYSTNYANSALASDGSKMLVNIYQGRLYSGSYSAPVVPPDRRIFTIT